jgi:hypothetical protein
VKNQLATSTFPLGEQTAMDVLHVTRFFKKGRIGFHIKTMKSILFRNTTIGIKFPKYLSVE